jgi:hypothetical protein
MAIPSDDAAGLREALWKRHKNDTTGAPAETAIHAKFQSSLWDLPAKVIVIEF